MQAEDRGPEQVIVRRAMVSDIDTLVEYHLALLRLSGFLTDEQATPTLAQQVRDYMHQMLPEGRFVAWVAEAGEHVVAGCGLSFSQKPPFPRNLSGLEGYISIVYTAPAWRRRGLATRLLREVVDHAHERGARVIRLHATAEGRPVYAKAGFEAPTNEMVLSF